VQLHGQRNSGLVVYSGRSYWPQSQGRRHTVAAISIHTKMNVEGQAREILSSATAECGERCRVISSLAGGGAAAASPMSFSSRTNLGLTMCLQRSSTIHSKGISRSSISARRAKNRTAFKGQTRWQLIQT